MSNPIEPSPDFFHQIGQILVLARQQAARAITYVMVIVYWQIGKRIVEEEQ